MLTALKVCLQDICPHVTCVLSFQSNESRGCLSLLLLSRLPGRVGVRMFSSTGSIDSPHKEHKDGLKIIQRELTRECGCCCGGSR